MASRGECNQRLVLKVAAPVYVPVLVITDVSDKPPASHQSPTEGSHRTVMAKEMVRVARPGGKVAAYVWDYAGGMEMLRHFWDVAIELNPKDSTLDQGQRFPLCQPEPLEALFRVAGLTSISVRAIEIPTVFRDFDDYWRPFLGKQGAAPSAVSHAVGTLSGVYHHEGHEDHEGREKHVEFRSLFYSRYPFFVSLVRFVVNRKTLIEHHGRRIAYQRDDNLP